MKKNIAIYITGSIAAYKVPLLVRSLIKDGHVVRVAMTKSAQNFVTANTLAILTKHPVLLDDNEFINPEHVVHVELANWADLSIVVPATANTIAKLANGLADNVVTSSLLATKSPKIIVPAMNNQMWFAQPTQENLATLKKYNYNILNPDTGFLAEGYSAKGKMPEPEIIKLFVDSLSTQTFLKDKNILISAGGTSEKIDPVRFLTNHSSGKMGTALANVAAAAGANVTLVTTKALPTLPNVNVENATSAIELQKKMQSYFGSQDIVIMAAAISDFRIDQPTDHKIKKESDTAGLDLHLSQNPDILKELGAVKTNQYLVGFAAETNDLIDNGNKKLDRKNVNMIVANQVGQSNTGFNADENKVSLLTKNKKPIDLPQASKIEVAKDILEQIKKEISSGIIQ